MVNIWSKSEYYNPIMVLYKCVLTTEKKIKHKSIKHNYNYNILLRDT